MRRYKYIPFDELRRQYRRERALKEGILSTLQLLVCFAGFIAYYLFS